MSEIDLIPGEFRQTIGRLRELRIAALLIVVAVVLSGSVGLVMEKLATSSEERRDQLARQHAVSDQQGSELTELSGVRDKLLRQRDTLGRLRGGAPFTDLMLTIDKALAGEEVWFIDWQFHRAGAGSDDEPASNGYFVVVDEDPDPMKIQTQMNISGQAVDHAALSLFVKRLFEQPEVKDVRVQQTTVRRYPTHRIVDFQLSVILQTKAS